MNGHLSTTHITMCLKPPKPKRRKSLLTFLELQDVAPDGVYMDQICHHICGKLLPHLFTLTHFHRRLFSVALSLEFPPLDVIQHHLLLWSPDFPRTLPHGLAIRDHSIYSFIIVLRFSNIFKDFFRILIKEPYRKFP